VISKLFPKILLDFVFYSFLSSIILSLIDCFVDSLPS
jgi:hypothetical protein